MLIGQDKDWLAQCQDNVTECNIRSWRGLFHFAVGQNYEIPMSVHCRKLDGTHPDMTVDVVCL